jgi:hypothetical protein
VPLIGYGIDNIGNTIGISIGRMWNGGYSQHRFSVTDTVACSSKLNFVFLDREITGTRLCLVL